MRTSLAWLILLAACDAQDPAPPPEKQALAPAPRPLLDRVEAMASELEDSCALRAGRVHCWSNGESDYELTAGTIASLTDIAAIDGGGGRTCAVGKAGELYCFGETLGENPTGVGVGHIPASRIDLGRPVTRVAVGARQICALTDRREIYCWGQGSGGVLAQPTAMTRAERVAEDADAVEVGDGWLCFTAAGKRSCRGPAPDMGGLTQQQNVIAPGWVLGSCGVPADRHVVCRGTHPLVTRGRPTPGAPPGEQDRIIEGVDEVRELAVGQEQACVVRTDGAVRCWTGSKPAQAIALPGPARAITAGIGHACAVVEEDGQVLCWRAGRDPVAVRFEEAPVATGKPPTIRVEEAIRRAQPPPADLAGTTWTACLTQPGDVRPPCSECEYTLRFAAGGGFVAEGRCPSLKTTTTWTGRWKRDGDRVTVREKPAPAGTRWEWSLEIRGQSVSGTRAVKDGWRYQVRAALAR